MFLTNPVIEKKFIFLILQYFAALIIFFDLPEALNKIFADINFDKVVKLEKLIEKSKKNKILVFGNGAGAAIASHFANDLSKSE